MKHSAMRNRRASLETLIRSPIIDSEKIDELATELWETLDTPISLSLSILLRYGEHKQIVSRSFEPANYLDWDSSRAFKDHQAIAFLKKYPRKIADVDPEAAAWETFLTCEEMCRQTNHRFRLMRNGGRVPSFVHPILWSAQRKISSWLGRFNAKSWALRCRFGPGADDLTKGPRVVAYHKLSALSSTKDFVEGAARLAFDHPQWARYLSGETQEAFVGPIGLPNISVARSNRVVFVPKNALTHRSIAIEPRMNIFAQLGLGALLRSRLKRAGLDLDEQEPSQVLAYLGSIHGTIATIDLSSASDTLSKEVVRELVPEEWLIPLEWCRSATGFNRERNKTFFYEKFSSMGNGFTFELESMVFYALVLSCVEYLSQDTSLVRVYGDDIALPASAVELTSEMLSFCGFSVNLKKSYSSGVFRESCGADFFNGRNIRPYYQKELLSYAESLFRLANGIRRVAYRRNHGCGCDGELRAFWIRVLRRIPKSLRALKGPGRPLLLKREAWCDMETNDGYLISNWDEAQSSPFVRKLPRGLQGWAFGALRLRGRLVRAEQDFDLLKLYALFSSRDGNWTVSSHRADHCGNTLIPVRGSSPPSLNLKAHAFTWWDCGSWH